MSIRLGDQIISGGVPTNRTEAIVNQNDVSLIGNIYNWVGTTQEYEEQNVALEHPEWVCYITDDETHDDQEVEIIHYTARNVGDIFLTSRSDEWLNGAIECNGSTHNLSDYSGAESINSLLRANKIPYVSLSDYATAISEKGWCDKFGWDGIEASTFKVPTLTAKIIQENNIPVIGNGMTIGITDGTYTVGFAKSAGNTGDFTPSGTAGETVGTDSGATPIFTGGLYAGVTTDPTKSGMIADVVNNAADLRVMVQLSTGFNDESVETLTTLQAEVTSLSTNKVNKGHEVIEFQAPTSENDYTWYRKYADGWIEQGGLATISSPSPDELLTINLPVQMDNVNYTVLTLPITNTDLAWFGETYNSRTTTSFEVQWNCYQYGGNVYQISWEAKGMFAQGE